MSQLRTLILLYAVVASVSAAEADIEKGRYIFQLANCYACHTDTENDGRPLAGGRALETEFGSFFTPNITADKETGIGNWSDEQFIQALTRGVAPDGRHYYPSFPYLSYRNMTKTDMLALKAYLFSQPAVHQQNKPHQLKWYMSQYSLAVWKFLNERLTGPLAKDRSRGSYLVDTLGHCNECHTPRNFLGMLQMDKRLQGNRALSAPEILPTKSGIGDWSDEELTDLFQYGELPDGDYVSDHMAEVVDYSTSKWHNDDLQAVIKYLRGEEQD
jgi:mono/diheme cytochrome c family protein